MQCHLTKPKKNHRPLMVQQFLHDDANPRKMLIQTSKSTVHLVMAAHESPWEHCCIKIKEPTVVKKTNTKNESGNNKNDNDKETEKHKEDNDTSHQPGGRTAAKAAAKRRGIKGQ